MQIVQGSDCGHFLSFEGKTEFFLNNYGNINKIKTFKSEVVFQVG